MRRKDKRFRWVWCLLIFSIICILSIIWVDRRLTPLVKAYGINHAKTVCTQVTHQAVTDFLNKNQINYQELITVNRRENGEIASLEADAMQINRLKADVTNTVLSELQKKDIQTMRIPFGSLTGSNLLSGRGPKIPLKTGINITVITNIKSEFFEAGINQTCHQLYLSLDIQLFAALSEEPQTVTISSEFLITETIISGTVPDTYAQWMRGTM